MSDNTSAREILTIDEAAAFLGVSVKTFNKVLHSEGIPGRKIGREWKFSRSALIAWIGNGKSADFYKDGREHELEPQSPPENGSPRPPSDSPGTRRTSGWRVKMD
jgi:excisionase family DNA binding protein